MFKSKQILVLAPHTDDGELGCGGTINKLVDEGHTVYYVAFSTCSKSIVGGFPKDSLLSEVKQAVSILGVCPENLFVYDYEVRTFNYKRQEILDDLIKLRELIKPDMVFIPTLDDVHQDHKTIAEEGLRAFKFCTLLCYEMPWNNISFRTSCFFTLSEKNISIKISALREYKSQAHRSYFNEEFIKSLAHTRGVQIGQKYAETFEVLRLMQ